jgi:hypothetical protein
VAGSLLPWAGLPGWADISANEERLCFQTSYPWSPRINLDADVAIVYGIGPALPAKIESWRRRGYTIHVIDGRCVGRVSRLPVR